jgi:hypothetical protein
MTALRSVLVCLPILGLSGCSWVPWLVCNVVGEPVDAVKSFCFCSDGHRLAHQAWLTVVAQHPDAAYSRAYADGFKTGFYDYISKDRTTDPRTIPPFCFRYPVLRTPEQQEAIIDWYAGFHHGATVAQEQRWREGVEVPISRPPLFTVSQFSTEVVPVGSPPAPPPTATPTPTPPLEVMPAPKRAQPPAELSVPETPVELGPLMLTEP